MSPKRRNISKKTVQSTKKTGIILLLLFFGCIGLSYFVYHRYRNRETVISHVEPGEVPIPKGFSSFGIDVSHHNGDVNWDKILSETMEKKSIQFVYCKATEGVGMVDHTWKQHRKRLKRAGIPFGAYHFFSDKSDPVVQAGHFLRNWNPEMSDLPPVLDIENMQLSRGDLIRRMDVWLSIVEKESGIQPVIYCSLNDYNQLFYDVFKGYKFWIAAYSKEPSVLQDERVIHWQFSERGELPGMENPIDFNYSKLFFKE